MKHARSDYNRIQDPANKIPADEPVFLIRAQDKVGSATVRMWAELNDLMGGDPAMSNSARVHAAHMENWTKKKLADMEPLDKAL